MIKNFQFRLNEAETGFSLHFRFYRFGAEPNLYPLSSDYYGESSSDENDYHIDWNDLLGESLAYSLYYDDGYYDGHNFNSDYDAYDYNATLFDYEKEPELSCQTLSLAIPGSDYIGMKSTTISGRRCQNWHDQVSNNSRNQFLTLFSVSPKTRSFLHWKP